MATGEIIVLQRSSSNAGEFDEVRISGSNLVLTTNPQGVLVGSTTVGSNGSCVQGNYSVIIGGINNNITASNAFIGGGSGNTISGSCAATLGGRSNVASGTSTFIGGGLNNKAYGNCSAIIGGNTNSTYQLNSFVGGGSNNSACSNNSAVNGGGSNVAHGAQSFIGGGSGNSTTGEESAIIGGDLNCLVYSPRTAIAGGKNNRSFGAIDAGIFAGYCNKIKGCGNNSTVVGGYCNAVSQSANSGIFAGYRNTIYDPSFTTFTRTIIGSVDSCLEDARQASIVGSINSSMTYAYCSVIVGGVNNCIYGYSAGNSGIFGGNANCISGWSSYAANTILGGCSGSIAAPYHSVIIGGCRNCVEGVYNTSNDAVVGGSNNTIKATSYSSTIIGGSNNQVTANCSAIVGGSSITLTQDNTLASKNTIFGNTSTDTHQFTGSLSVLGSADVSDNFIVPNTTTSSIIPPLTGSLVFDTGSLQFRGYNGTSWVTLG